MISYSVCESYKNMSKTKIKKLKKFSKKLLTNKFKCSIIKKREIGASSSVG